MRIRTVTATLALTATALIQPRAGAAIITVGQSYTPTGTTAAARPELNGTVLADTTVPIDDNFGSAFNFAGSLESKVVRSSATGHLIFEYQLTQSTPQPGAPGDVASALLVTNFYGYTTDVDYRTDEGGTVAPSNITRIQENNPTFQTLRWDFGPLANGQTTDKLIVLTNANDYQSLYGGGILMSNGTSTVDLSIHPVYQPIDSVPEPTAAGSVALLCSYVVARRRRR